MVWILELPLEIILGKFSFIFYFVGMNHMCVHACMPVWKSTGIRMEAQCQYVSYPLSRPYVCTRRLLWKGIVFIVIHI